MTIINPIRIVFALVICSFVAYLVIFVCDKPEVRYQEYPCQYALTYIDTNEGKDTIAIFGNSRALRAVNTTVLQEGVNTKNIKVLNYSRSWRGQEHNYIFLRDLLERKPINYALIEYNRYPGDERRYHPYFFRQLRTKDLAKLAYVDKEVSWLEKPSYFLNWLLQRASLRFQQLIVGEMVDLKQLGEQPISKLCEPATNRILAERNEKVYQQRAKKWLSGEDSWQYSSRKESINTYFTRYMLETSKKHNVNAALYFVPRLFNSPVPEKQVQKAAKYYQTQIFMPNNMLLESLYEKSKFRDPTHMNPKGNRQYTLWLYEKASEGLFHDE